MASISFERVPKNNNGYRFDALRVLVDGVDFISLVKAVEEPFARAEGSPGIAGGYAYLSMEEALNAYLPSDAELDDDGRVCMLNCGDCGDAGCWPLKVRITISDDEVTWSDFVQPHRQSGDSPWDLSGLGPFKFERREYEQAIQV